MEDVYIVGAARTPMGGMQGTLADAPASQLGGVAIAAALAAGDVAPDDVNEVLMGCVLPGGQGQAPARQAGFAAGLGEDVTATTINKMCGSGMKATMMGYDQLALGHGQVMVTGGMESMTQAPYLLPKMRGGARLGHGQVQDSMFLDGLEDAYDKGRLMGTFAEDCAMHFQFSRAAQDAYALRSLERALAAQASGAAAAEIAPVTLVGRKATVEVVMDEQPGNARPDKIPHLKPCVPGGRHSDSGQFFVDFGWGGGSSFSQCLWPCGKGLQAARARHGARQPRTSARLVHHRTSSCGAKTFRSPRLGCCGCGFVGGQRGLCCGAHGLHA
jgi:acetyl-CoA C-acetyltransferase